MSSALDPQSALWHSRFENIRLIPHTRLSRDCGSATLSPQGGEGCGLVVFILAMDLGSYSRLNCKISRIDNRRWAILSVPPYSWTGLQPPSGLNSLIALATSMVFFPRSFSYTTPFRLVMNVITPVSPYFSG